MLDGDENPCTSSSATPPNPNVGITYPETSVSSDMDLEVEPELEDNEVQLPVLKTGSAPEGEGGTERVVRNEIPDSENLCEVSSPDEEVLKVKDAGNMESTANNDAQKREANDEGFAISLLPARNSASDLDSSVLDSKGRQMGDNIAFISNLDSKEAISPISPSHESSDVAELQNDGMEVSTEAQAELSPIKSTTPLSNGDIYIATEARGTEKTQDSVTSLSIQDSEISPSVSPAPNNQATEAFKVQDEDEVLPNAVDSSAQEVSSRQLNTEAPSDQVPTLETKAAETQNGGALPNPVSSQVLAEQQLDTSQQPDIPSMPASKSVEKQDIQPPAQLDKATGSSQRSSKAPTPNSSLVASNRPRNKDVLKAELKAMKIVRLPILLPVPLIIS